MDPMAEQMDRGPVRRVQFPRPMGVYTAEIVMNDVAMWLLITSEFEPTVRSVWIRNLAPAPKDIEVDGLFNGSVTRNPLPFVRHPGAGRRPVPEDIEFVWFPEGNGVGLFERGECVAILPPWDERRTRTPDDPPGQQAPGYSLEAAAAGPFALPLEGENALLDELERARDFWERWGGEVGNARWHRFAEERSRALSKAFGAEPATSFVLPVSGWPPRMVLRFDLPTHSILTTIGASVLPQPNARLAMDDPRPIRRMELAVAVPTTATQDQIMAVGSHFGSLSTWPWRANFWLGDAQTIEFPAWPVATFGVAAVQAEPPALDGGPILLGEEEGDPVNLLWLVPMTVDERDRAADPSDQMEVARLPADRWKAGW